MFAFPFLFPSVILENKFDMNNRFKVILAGGRQYGGF